MPSNHPVGEIFFWPSTVEENMNRKEPVMSPRKKTSWRGKRIMVTHIFDNSLNSASEYDMEPTSTIKLVMLKLSGQHIYI